MQIIQIILLLGLAAAAVLVGIIFLLCQAGKQSDKEREMHYEKRNEDHP